MSEALDLVNEGRLAVGLEPAGAADAAAMWAVLQDERGAVLWLEGRRFWDLRRWAEDTGPARNSFLDGRDRCVPISQSERASNANLQG